MKGNKRKQIRIPNYDYSENGYYFVTICSNARKNMFGEYRIPVGAGLVSARNNDNFGDNCFELSTIGAIIESKWLDIPHQYDNVELDEYVIMPNHIHGIIVINKTKKRADTRPAPTLPDILIFSRSGLKPDFTNCR
ncbi:MAG: hypothetical protein JXL81_04120 [Deltaproteobacteria bacterium]|nr:hypothetical protein [Deltaproteobacteria bacterium]